MGKKVNEVEFLKRLELKHGINISPVDKFINFEKKLLFKCNICNHSWLARPRIVCTRTGCPQCGKIKSAITPKYIAMDLTFFNKIKQYSSIEILSEYQGCNSPIQVKCLTCNKIWWSKPNYLYRKQLCADCGRERKNKQLRKTQEQFIQEVYKSHGESIIVLGKYFNSVTKVQVECQICKFVWLAAPKGLIGLNKDQRGCPQCCSSKAENKIQKIFNEYHILYKKEFIFKDLKSRKGKPLRFDFVVFGDNEQIKYLIECDGQQHFRSIKFMGGNKRLQTQKENDILKNEYCLRNNYVLIRIPYTSFDKIDKNMVII